MSDFYSYQPQNGHGLPHDPMKSLIAPRMIGWISSSDDKGNLNLAPYSFFGIFCDKPPILAFSSEGRKDTVKNIERTGEFVYNMATRNLAEQMNLTATPAAPDVNEFTLAKLETAPSQVISVPRVALSPVSMECLATDIRQIQDRHGNLLDRWMVFGEVVAVHIASTLLVDGIYDTAGAHPIMRGGGAADYFEATTESRFQMYRPT
jgi:flavin reductase (DIM6/NTAB) family NADH-FMN oxidoreductase RutF